MNKNSHKQNESKILEKIKWLSVSVFFILSIFINYYFYEKQLLLRILIIFFLVICSISILLCTKKGKNIFSYIKMSKKEMQKITWPEYKETLYTTFIVISVTIIISLILWGLDNIIFRLIAFIISLRF
ncbi:preprotein translocase subunit SecE [Buchnera aphidicola]|uniref:Protein translocase subunit SecE n=1 Tax=Buchnera aphidicola str. USDA (Myzus persicae) TaxID=1009856 RepID=W0P4M3_BUCMP|nr:preprotein translocase subunit SecE [Buchnera aphidicola]AHG60320.1 Sece [Buchnera aphidicola str. USDA (Myzus persicae)]AHG60898.1 Sece [Buchnera aphidicola str. W106 (Myzus persicae)]AHG61470.1 Sece [Buchnera aphidicola str. G002 (Myzus persicae)]AHG62043.1 Sece [Buchnera aphidicola str. F009 (Myzus persicae)]WAI02994.1 MAG: preprotein translocase subunit SecE [Buchnera aphidicola (Myzus persicae)]